MRYSSAGTECALWAVLGRQHRAQVPGPWSAPLMVGPGLMASMASLQYVARRHAVEPDEGREGVREGHDKRR